jgi:acetolactate synthase regulatory subunit
MPTTDLTIELQPGTDALRRVLTLCVRRGIDIRRLSYVEGSLELSVGGERAERLCAWMDGLVDVLAVEQHSEVGGRPAA